MIQDDSAFAYRRAKVKIDGEELRSAARRALVSQQRNMMTRVHRRAAGDCGLRSSGGVSGNAVTDCARKAMAGNHQRIWRVYCELRLDLPLGVLSVRNLVQSWPVLRVEKESTRSPGGRNDMPLEHAPCAPSDLVQRPERWPRCRGQPFIRSSFQLGATRNGWNLACRHGWQDWLGTRPLRCSIDVRAATLLLSNAHPDVHGVHAIRCHG